MTDESHQLTNGDAKKVTKAADRVYSGVRMVGMLCTIIVVFQFALQWQILQLDDHTTSASNNTEELKVSVAQVDQVVSELHDFAVRIEETTPEEQANSDAVQRAVALVPVILSVLCDLVPDNPHCQSR